MADVMVNIEYPEVTPARVIGIRKESHKINLCSEQYTRALRDWVERGSEYALPLTRSSGASSRGMRTWCLPRPAASSAKTFAMSARRARRSSGSGTCTCCSRTTARIAGWLTDARKIGVEYYYPPLDM